ncbi:putative NBD/HSP70 family sugar kinase [Trichococcus patagoniensis]|uniref:Putative NBD/HSP70 family sugar kinase n=1 Tax=Trichococcus patagoniensis TaxID=382641 RepID=A0A2T5INT3_9LACT|nr:ROK family transcriptional regulator [Trichococcus patagoniensis]PTQ85469.1 putative NBD/HSP70 family sugar kinase [Trichococcus patagoniensis]
MIHSKYTIRENNEANILNAIISQKEISRAELSVHIGLNKASVSAITKKLLDDELIHEDRIGDAARIGGRKPIMLTFNGKAALTLSLDVAPNYIEGLIAYIDGKVLYETEIRGIKVSSDNVLAYIAEMVEKLTRHAEETPHGIIGICVAIHGLVNQDTILFTPYYTLPSDLKAQLEEIYPFYIHLENEANLAGLGEYTFGAASDSIVSLSIHTGIGAGIVENGKLRTGKKGAAGEIGHSILFPDGRKCPCGNEGCLEQYASHQAIYNELEQALALPDINSSVVIERYKKDDPIVQKALRTNAHYLSIAVNNLAVIYEPDLVVINSSIYSQLPELISILKGDLKGKFSCETKVANSSLKKKATLFGGVAKSTQNFLNIQNLKMNAES